MAQTNLDGHLALLSDEPVDDVLTVTAYPEVELPPEQDVATSLDEQQTATDNRPPTPILEHVKIACRTRINWADIGKGGHYDFDIYPPLFVQGALASPALLAHVLNRPYSGLAMARRMVPGTLRSISWTVNRATCGFTEKGFLVLGRSSNDQIALDNFHGLESGRVSGSVHTVLSDGSECMIDAVVWRLRSEGA